MSIILNFRVSVVLNFLLEVTALVLVVGASSSMDQPHSSACGLNSRASLMNSQQYSSPDILAAGQLFQAVRAMSPLPTTWSSSVPLGQWGNGVKYPAGSECVSLPSTSMFSLTLSSSFLISLNVENSTLFLNDLPLSTPMCGIWVNPTAAHLLTVVANYSALPTALQTLSLPNVNLTAVSTLGPKHINFVNLSMHSLTFVNVSNTSIAGPVDFTLTPQVPPLAAYALPFVIDVSNNPNLVGGIDLVNLNLSQTLSGDVLAYRFDIRSTNISLVILATGGNAARVLNTSSDGSNTHSVLANPGTHVMEVNTGSIFDVEYGYYCRSPSRSHGNNTNGTESILQLLHEDGQVWLRMMDYRSQNTACSIALTSRYVTYDIGYIYDSPMLAAMYPCAPNTTLYATKTAAIAYEIALHDSHNEEPMIYSFCQNPTSISNGKFYFSVSLGQHDFFDFIGLGSNISSRGMLNGVYRVCTFPWPFITQVGVGTGGQHEAYNAALLLKDLGPCIPFNYSNGTTRFSAFETVVLSQDGMSVTFLDSTSQNLTLRRFSFAPVPNTTYCMTTKDHAYTMVVNPFSTTITVTSVNSSESVSQSPPCVFDGIFQYQTLPYGSDSFNTLRDLDTVMASLSSCFPPSNDGSVRQWNPTLSRLQLAVGSYTLGDLIFVDNVTEESLIFSNATCEPLPEIVTFCSSVDLYSGWLFLDIAPDRSGTLVIYRSVTGGGGLFQNYTVCPGAMIRFDASGDVYNLDDIVLQWTDCFPAQSATSNFGSNVTSMYIDGGSAIQNSSTIVLTTSDGNSIQLSTSACLGAAREAVLAEQAQHSLCPSLVTANTSLTQATFCVGSLCSDEMFVEWKPSTDTSPTAAVTWKIGSTLASSSIPVNNLVAVGNRSGGTISSCYPTCIADTSSCGQIALMLVELVVCYSSHGVVIGQETPLPSVDPSCISDDRVIFALSLVHASQQFHVPEVRAQCMGAMGDAVALLAAGSNTEVEYVVAVSDSAGQYYPLLYAANERVPGLDIHCTPCQSLWLQKLYPTPLLFIFLNALVNVLQVLLTNFVLQPRVGPFVIRARVRLLLVFGILSRREVRAHMKWCMRLLTPVMATRQDVLHHIDFLCHEVFAERRRQSLAIGVEVNQLQDNGRNSSRNSSTINVDMMSSRSRRDTVEEANGGNGTFASEKMMPSSIFENYVSVRRNAARLNALAETDDELIEGDERFREVYELHLMCHMRMLGRMTPTCLRKLVDLRDACSRRRGKENEEQPATLPEEVYNSDAFDNMSSEFPLIFTHENPHSLTEVHEGESALLGTPKTLLKSEKSFNSVWAAVSKPFSLGDSGALRSNASFDTLSDQDQLEDAINAVDKDTTADWVPYCTAQDWLEQNFLTPKGWLLSLQVLHVLVSFAVTFDSTMRITGAVGAWEVLSAFYFLFLSGSAPVSLLTNAAFRVVYDRSFTAGIATDSGDGAEGGNTGAWHRTLFRHTSKMLRDPFFLFSVVMLSPAIFTHILIGLIIFPFLPIGCWVVIRSFGLLRVRAPEKSTTRTWMSPRAVASVLTHILYRNSILFVVVATSQLSFNYAHMLYMQSDERFPSWEAWVNIISSEYKARSITCAVFQLQKGVESAWNLFYSQLI